MTPRRATILLIVGVVVLVVGAIGFWQIGAPALFPGPTATPLPSPTLAPTFAAPPANFTPPPSLEELATEYPELGDVLLNSELSSVYKDFLVAYQTGGIDAARQLANDRGLLDDQDRVRLLIELDTSDTAELEAQLESNGVQVLATHENLMEVAIPLRVVQAAASQENPGAIFDKITQLDHVIRIRLPNPVQTKDDPVPGEGVKVTGAELWHQAGITGKGVKVAVLDLGFGGYTRLLGHGLPEHVTAMSFVPGEAPEDSAEIHGTAVAEIVSEMAPDVDLYLAYFDDEISFSNALDWLVSQNVQIISASFGWSIGPMDGSDQTAKIVDSLAERGILWVNAAGNEAEKHYRGQFTDSDNDGCHEFPDGTEAMGLITGPGGVDVALNWDDWTNVTKDFDLYVYDSNGNLVGVSADTQNGQAGQIPAERVFDSSVPEESTMYAEICSSTGASQATFDMYVDGYAVEFPTPDHSLSSPADARGAFTVAALDWATGDLAEYSSRGPTNDGRIKPDIGAPTRVSSATYAPEAFEGTSSATPHVSGAAALVWSANPGFTAEDVRNYLEENAVDLPPAGPDAETGFGALRLPAPPGVDPATATAAVATEIAFVATNAPAPVPAPGGPTEPLGTSTTTLLLGLLCGGFLICGFGLVLVGGAALVVAAGRRKPRPAPPPPLPGVPAPAVPPPTDPVPPPPIPTPIASPRAAGATAMAPDMPARAGLKTESGKTYYVAPGGVTLGRAPECDIVLDSTQVSRRHATFKLEGASWAVRDLGSSNGTFLNGERLEPNVTYRLSAGDEIVLGGHGGAKLAFVVE